MERDNAAPRQMTLVAFLQAANCSNYPASWRHPASAPDFLTAAYFQRIARVLEEGKFHLAFCDDRLAMPDRYGDDFTTAVRHGIRAVKMDLIPVLTAMGLATQHLGLGGTYSTTYYEPFHVARVFATLDHLLSGRVAWNVVTSLNDSEASNFGQGPHPDHDLVYDRAQGLFAHPEKVHRLEHHGAWFHSRGPFTVPRSPQGRPVIMQAGHSGRGRRFAARWGELIFVIVPSPEFGRDVRRAIQEEAARCGREPQHLRVLPAMYCVIGETRTAAQEKAAYIEQLAQPMDALVLLSEVLNLDFAPHGLDEPLSDTDLAAISGSRAIYDRVIHLSGKRNPTTRDFITHSGRGTLHELPLFVATPHQVADGLEEWITTAACDGFVLAATHIPGAYEDFVRLVVPELQRRGLFHREYAGVTLRESVGLPRPQRGDWACRKAEGSA